MHMCKSVLNMLNSVSSYFRSMAWIDKIYVVEDKVLVLKMLLIDRGDSFFTLNLGAVRQPWSRRAGVDNNACIK